MMIEPTIKDKLKRAIIAHKEGKIKEAESLYKAVLQKYPKQPDANHNLGLLAVSVNRYKEALPFFKTALETNPSIRQFWLSYVNILIKDKQFENAKKIIGEAENYLDKDGLIALKAIVVDKSKSESINIPNPPQQKLTSLLECYNNGKFDDAEKLSNSIIYEFPKHPFSWKVLSAIYKDTGRNLEALNAIQNVVELSPKDAEAYYNLGIILKELGRLEEAETNYIKAVELKTDFAEAHNNLGNTLKEQGKLDKAEISYRQAITLKTDFAEAYFNLGGTLQQMGKFDGAEANYRQAITLKNDYAEAYNNLGAIFKQHGKLEEAEINYRQVIALKKEHAEAYNNLGATLQELNKLDEAEFNYRKAIKLKNDYAEAHNNLGAMLLEFGRIEKAEKSLKKAIEFNQNFAEAHRNLSIVKKYDSEDKQYLKMQELYLNKNISEEQRCHINFGLAKACEDLEDFKQAFKYYSEGNEIRKKILDYNISQDIKIFKQLKSSYSTIEQNSLKLNTFGKKTVPIFIVGMLRSGTTLVEQIISSHSKVMGAGELRFVTQFGDSLARGYADINNVSLIDFRKKYLSKIQNISNDNTFITDKFPQNFCYIGLLNATLPEAKILHVKRNPAAVCWANYKKYFVSRKIGYCYSLDDIIKYHSLYESLIAFWKNKLPNRIYDVDYELLTLKQEDETRKLINFIGLNWEDKCLSPQNNTRSVATASNTQVRKKIYQGSSQEWKKYRPFLNGKLDF